MLCSAATFWVLWLLTFSVILFLMNTKITVPTNFKQTSENRSILRFRPHSHEVDSSTILQMTSIGTCLCTHGNTKLQSQNLIEKHSMWSIKSTSFHPQSSPIKALKHLPWKGFMIRMEWWFLVNSHTGTGVLTILPLHPRGLQRFQRNSAYCWPLIPASTTDKHCIFNGSKLKVEMFNSRSVPMTQIQQCLHIKCFFFHHLSILHTSKALSSVLDLVLPSSYCLQSNMLNDWILVVTSQTFGAQRRLPSTRHRLSSLAVLNRVPCYFSHEALAPQLCNGVVKKRGAD